MHPSDIIGFSLFASFGFWWMLFPNSVVRLYAWLYRDKKSMSIRFHTLVSLFFYGRDLPASPKPLAIRITGLAWLVLLCIVLFSVRRKVGLSG
jgi:hypothetical protein